MQSSGTHSFLLDDLWARFACAYHTLSARETAVINDDSFIHGFCLFLCLNTDTISLQFLDSCFKTGVSDYFP